MWKSEYSDDTDEMCHSASQFSENYGETISGKTVKILYNVLTLLSKLLISEKVQFYMYSKCNTVTHVASNQSTERGHRNVNSCLSLVLQSGHNNLVLM